MGQQNEKRNISANMYFSINWMFLMVGPILKLAKKQKCLQLLCESYLVHS